MRRTIRYQAAIVREDQLLLLRITDLPTGATFWLLPGGGREAGETEEACVRREVYEETFLRVSVERLLFDYPDIDGGAYDYLRTFLCRVVEGEAQPGYEPEVDTDEHRTIQEVRWFDLRDSGAWAPLLLADPFMLGQLGRLRTSLGYGATPAAVRAT